MKIAALQGREIFDSRGVPTLECDLVLDNGMVVTASVPSGASRGKHEAYELRDGGKRLMGLGVHKAIRSIEDVIAPVLIGKEIDAPGLDQVIIELDGTSNKKKLGANATLAVSMALYRAHALSENSELYEFIAWISGRKSVAMPIPLFNVINGGAHSDNSLLIQEIMIVPIEAKSFRESLECSVTLYHILKDVLKKQGKSVAVGDEGGFASSFDDEIEALNCLVEALSRYEKQGKNIFAIALDMAASQFYKPKTKKYDWHGDKVTSNDMIEYYEQLIKLFPIYSIEDGLAEDDWQGWTRMMKAIGDKVQLVGDDIFSTNASLIKKGVQKKAANSVVIKPNQIGTVSEALYSIKISEDNDLDVIVSHRSGETEDVFIADLAVGGMAGQIKAGGCSRSERMAKYNRLLRIEDSLMSSMMLDNLKL